MCQELAQTKKSREQQLCGIHSLKFNIQVNNPREVSKESPIIIF